MISAFIPTYNSARTLEKTVTSLKNQTVKPDRIIIVDSGSTDETENIAISNGIEYFPPSYFGFDFLGLGRARNRVLELIDTPYLLSVDSDIVLERNYIEKMLPLFKKDAKIAGVGAKQIEFNRVDLGDSCRATIEMRDLFIPLKEQKPEFPDFLLGSNNIYKTEFLHKIGKSESGNKFRPFNDSLASNYEDADLGIKIRKHNGLLFKTPEILTYHLQKDTLKTFIDRAYRYRVFKWELKNAFSSYVAYKGKKEHNINYALMGLNIAESKNRKKFFYPVILVGFYFFLKDCIRFLDYNCRNEAEIVFNSINKSVSFFNDNIKKEITALLNSFAEEFYVEPSSLKIDNEIIEFFKKLSCFQQEEIPGEKVCTENIVVNFYNREFKVKNMYVINYVIEKYNIDELYFELKSLNPKNISITGNPDYETKKIIENLQNEEPLF